MNSFTILIFSTLSINFWTVNSIHHQQHSLSAIPFHPTSNSTSPNVLQGTPYSGGAASTLVKILAPSQLPHKISDYTPPIPHLFPWKTFGDFFLGGKNQHLNEKIDYDPFYVMKPRQGGILHEFETSGWYQRRASFCVNSNPDSYSLEGFLCSGMTDFGINLFIEFIAFKELMMCAAIGWITGDSLFCLAWYLLRFFFRDYIPTILKEEYNYEDNRIALDI